MKINMRSLQLITLTKRSSSFPHGLCAGHVSIGLLILSKATWWFTKGGCKKHSFFDGIECHCHSLFFLQSNWSCFEAWFILSVNRNLNQSRRHYSVLSCNFFARVEHSCKFFVVNLRCQIRFAIAWSKGLSTGLNCYCRHDWLINDIDMYVVINDDWVMTMPRDDNAYWSW